MGKPVAIDCPALIHIGPQKTASTWLAKALRQHEAFRFSLLKEVHFFTQSDGANGKEFLRKRVLDRVELRRQRVKFFEWRRRRYLDGIGNPETIGSDRWYADLFLANPSIRDRLRRRRPTVLCDFTPHYTTMSRAGFQRLGRLLPRAHLMLVIRDPIKRMRSGFSMALSREPDLAGMPAARQIEHLEATQVSRGDYRHALEIMESLGMAHSVFAFGDLVANPGAVVRKLETAFGLDHCPVDFERVKKVNSHSGRFELAPEVVERIEALCAPQNDYLREKFGEAFMARI